MFQVLLLDHYLCTQHTCCKGPELPSLPFLVDNCAEAQIKKRKLAAVSLEFSGGNLFYPDNTVAYWLKNLRQLSCCLRCLFLLLLPLDVVENVSCLQPQAGWLAGPPSTYQSPKLLFMFFPFSSLEAECTRTAAAAGKSPGETSSRQFQTVAARPACCHRSNMPLKKFLISKVQKFVSRVAMKWLFVRRKSVAARIQISYTPLFLSI